ncbi:hypothetical protein [Helicobacter salomonis]|uniref:hypothetical protein n=1 Tax=Helicobacter salomonis TaxID=56878 RepID=UPI0013156204|nr:hypothetical protein [Helicobacter salomonis]
MSVIEQQSLVLANLIKEELQARNFLATEPNQTFIECVSRGIVRYLYTPQRRQP